MASHIVFARHLRSTNFDLKSKPGVRCIHHETKHVALKLCFKSQRGNTLPDFISPDVIGGTRLDGIISSIQYFVLIFSQLEVWRIGSYPSMDTLLRLVSVLVIV